VQGVRGGAPPTRANPAPATHDLRRRRTDRHQGRDAKRQRARHTPKAESQGAATGAKGALLRVASGVECKARQTRQAARVARPQNALIFGIRDARGESAQESAVKFRATACAVRPRRSTHILP
jgi:hypothetical protein